MSDQNPSDLQEEPSDRNGTSSGDSSTNTAQTDDPFGAGQGLDNLNRSVNSEELLHNQRHTLARPPKEYQRAALVAASFSNPPHMLQGPARRLKIVQEIARISEGTGCNARAEKEFRRSKAARGG
ncbi:hypothetical protein GLAREA_06833 [Glarea lozoyensis ATCC 20868]|uniref:Uncharacterized protein n=1 Tax=Glarea lozoyensis (strain ATCC 20868 / MF5171) TaxID=1116229 RepID=S3D7W0_GLAL2|nr:uncharacterized protein GLAREA_06833 [Glarea lozoyensis ATCC 20868]EPE33820.1 hypothetical protein GLAREA_06833 [Glarea lozoyensis ATCC 20868]